MDAKIGFDNINLDYYLPFSVNNRQYFLSYYEVSRETKTINLLPMLVDSNRESKGKDPLMEDYYSSRSKGVWYIAITVHNAESSDCLSKDFKNKEEVTKYLKNLKDEYLATYNYKIIKMERLNNSKSADVN